MSRLRTKGPKYFSGHWLYDGKAWYTPDHEGDRIVNTAEDTCLDTVHTPPFSAESDLHIISWDCLPARATYHYNASNAHHWGWNVPVLPGGAGYSYGINWSALESAAVHRVQDVEPLVDIPLAIGELKDFPKLLQQAAKGLRKQLSGDGHLAYHFGIKPMVSDILALLNLQKSIADRIRRHRRKFTTKRGRGKLSKPYYLISSGAGDSTQNVGYSYFVTVLQSTKIVLNEGWYTARLEPQVALPELLEQQADFAYQTGLAGSQGFTTLYNLVPWSWLIDYFSNLGDAISYGSNMVPYKVLSVCLMAQCKIRRTAVIANRSGAISFTPGWVVENVKRRKVVTNPSGKFVVEPLLSSGQVANLVALASSKSLAFGRGGA